MTKYAERSRRYRDRNPEKARANARRWQGKNPEKVKAMRKRWIASLSPERLAEYRRRHRARARRYYYANRDACNAKTRAHRKAHPEIELQRRVKRYGITPERFNELLALQGGRCAICKTANPVGRGYWHIDHDHVTGVVRGLLCHHCNCGLGHFRDDVGFLNAAAAYLGHHATGAA